MQKYLFQFVSHEDGSRSDAYIATWDEVATAIMKNDDTRNEDYILLVAIIDPDNEQEMVVPRTPLITIKNFITMMNPTDPQLDEGIANNG